jgi:hypothetical protein
MIAAANLRPADLEAALRQADDLGRRHGWAAEHWQIGDSGSGQEFYQQLLDAIASADPE